MNPQKTTANAKSRNLSPYEKLGVKQVYEHLKEIKKGLSEAVKQSDANLKLLFLQFNYNKPLYKTAKLFNLSKNTICRVVKPNDDQENEPSKASQRQSRLIECDDFTISTIRRILQDFYSVHEFPNVTKLWNKCMEDANFPRVGRSTFHKWLVKNCKFKYKKINKKPVFMERPDIIVQRATYLRKIKQYRDSGFHIFYSDETWTSPEQTKSKLWLMYLTPEERKEFDDIWSGNVLQDMNGWCGKCISIRKARKKNEQYFSEYFVF